MANRQSYIGWIAWRNLVSKKRRSGLSIMTLISIFGVAIGVATLIIVLSVMGGFEEDLQKKMLSGEPHLEIEAKNAAVGFSLNKYPMDEFKKLVPENTATEAFVKADVVLKHRKHLQNAVLFGVNPKLKSHLWIFSDTMSEGSIKELNKMHFPVISEDKREYKSPGIVLGEALAGNLGVNIGDEILIINPQAAVDEQAVVSGITSTRRFVLVGIFRSGSLNFDGKWAVVTMREARKFMADYDESLDDENYVSGIAMKLKDPLESEKIATRFTKFSELAPLTWQKANKSLLFALKLEKFAMGSILMLIVVVAAFSISGTMMMTVFHKRTQVSLLRAIGLTKTGIAKLYLLHGMSIGVIGICGGFFLGVGVCYLIHRFHFIDLPPGVYYIKSLPVKFLPNVYGVICGCALLFSALASAYPALTAARYNPSAGLRGE